MSLFLKLLAGSCWVGALAVFVIALPAYRQQYLVLKTWPEAQAEVISSRVVEHPTASGPLYATELGFAFTVDGRPVLGEYVFPHESTSRERKEKQAHQYPAGSRHAIRYDPADPADVRVNAGYNVDFFVVPVFLTGVAAIFGAVGGLLWGAARLARRRASRPAT